jgi:hypothetical protein
MRLKSALFALFIAALVVTPALSAAQEATSETATPERWIVLGGFSRHSCRDCGFRERNPGLALQLPTAWDDWRATFGTYVNSNDRQSYYAGAQWLPLRSTYVKAGAQLALISGYKEVKVVPALIPMISLEYKSLGADLFLVPKIPGVSSAAFLTFKFKF